MQHTTTAMFFTISMHHMHQVLAHNDVIKAIQKKKHRWHCHAQLEENTTFFSMVSEKSKNFASRQENSNSTSKSVKGQGILILFLLATTRFCKDFFYCS